jgi:tRNA (guanosine-2'-O-)-methyltransferase
MKNVNPLDTDQLCQLINYLEKFVTGNRSRLFEKVLDQRTRYICVVLEDIYQSQNASAVLRTCDCTGIQDAYIIENRYEFTINPEVTLGSAQWIETHRFPSGEGSTTECLNQLKSKGYRIVVTTPHCNDKVLDDFDISAGPFALVFGTEKAGLSETAISLADEFVKIPMYGFTESYNISVSAALCLFYFTQKLRQSGINWQLDEIERLEIKLAWLRASIRSCEQIEKHYYKKNLPG